MLNRTLNETYLLTKVVLDSGVAVVYKGRDLRTNTVVAIKVLYPYFARQPLVAERFLKDAEPGELSVGSHVLRVLETGQDGDAYYIVTEYPKGRGFAAPVWSPLWHLVRQLAGPARQTADRGLGVVLPVVALAAILAAVFALGLPFGSAPTPTAVPVAAKPSGAGVVNTPTPAGAAGAGALPSPATTSSFEEAWAATRSRAEAAWEKDWPNAVAALEAFHAAYPEYGEATEKLYVALLAYGQSLIRGGLIDEGAWQLQRAQAIAPDRQEAAAMLAQLPRPPKPVASPGPRLDEDARSLNLPRLGPPPGSRLERAISTAGGLAAPFDDSPYWSPE